MRVSSRASPAGRSLVECGSLLPLCGGSGLPEGGGEARGGARREREAGGVGERRHSRLPKKGASWPPPEGRKNPGEPFFWDRMNRIYRMDLPGEAGMGAVMVIGVFEDLNRSPRGRLNSVHSVNSVSGMSRHRDTLGPTRVPSGNPSESFSLPHRSTDNQRRKSERI